MNWEQATVCSSTAEKPTVIQPPTISGRSNGVTSMHRLFQLCMRSTKSEAVGRCFTQMI